MAYSASSIAHMFVNTGIENKLPITQMKLQKMLYFAQGLHLACHDRSPLIEENFQAWKYGPVIPQIYYQYKFYGSDPIQDFEMFDFFNSHFKSEKLNDEAIKTVQTTWEFTKNIDAIRLSNWTHNDGSPWKKYFNGSNDVVIPNDDIAEYFETFLKQNAIV